MITSIGKMYQRKLNDSQKQFKVVTIMNFCLQNYRKQSANTEKAATVKVETIKILIISKVVQMKLNYLYNFTFALL